MTSAHDKALQFERRAGGHRQHAENQVEQGQQDGRQGSRLPAPADRGGKEQEHEEGEERAGIAFGQQDQHGEQGDIDRVTRSGQLGVKPPIAPGKQHDSRGEGDIGGKQRVG